MIAAPGRQRRRPCIGPVVTRVAQTRRPGHRQRLRTSRPLRSAALSSRRGVGAGRCSGGRTASPRPPRPAGRRGQPPAPRRRRRPRRISLERPEPGRATRGRHGHGRADDGPAVRQEIHVSWSGAHRPAESSATSQLRPRAAGGVPVRAAAVPGRRLGRAPASTGSRPRPAGPQSRDERFTVGNEHFPPWRSTGTTPPRTARSRGPAAHLPGRVRPIWAAAEHWVPFDRGGRHGLPGGTSAVRALPPETANASAAEHCPSNTTYGVTALDGTGSPTSTC